MGKERRSLIRQLIQYLNSQYLVIVMIIGKVKEKKESKILNLLTSLRNRFCEYEVSLVLDKQVQKWKCPG